MVFNLKAFGRIWESLTRPSNALTAPDEREQASLLAATMLAFLPLMMTATFIVLPIALTNSANREVPNGTLFMLGVGVISACGLAYVLSRTRHYRTGGIVFTGFMAVAIYLAAVFGQVDVVGRISIILWLPLIVLAASTFVSTRVTAALSVASLGMIALLPSFHPDFILGNVVGVLIYTLAFCALTIATKVIRFRLYTTARRQAQESALLDTVRTAMAREVDLSRLFRTIIKSITETFGYTLVSLYRLDGDSLILQRQAGYYHALEKVPVSHGIAGRVARSGIPVLLEDADSDPEFLEAISGIISEVCVPLMHEGRVAGILNVESVQGVKLTEADLNLMVRLSKDIEVAIGRAQLYDEIQRELAERKRAEEAVTRYTERLETLHRIDRAILVEETPEAIAEATLQRLRQVLPLIGSSVMLFNLDDSVADVLAVSSVKPRNLKVGARLPLAAFDLPSLQTGEVFRLDNVETDLPTTHPYRDSILAEGIRSYINVPMRIQERLIGTLNLSAAQANAFSQDEVEIAREVALQLAVAIQQARLRMQVVRHAEELEQNVAQRTAELEEANSHLQTLSRAKDEFVSNVSHELRTPITNLKLYLELIGTAPDKHGLYLATLKRESLRLEDLIESLLLLSRMDQNRVPVTLATVDLNALTEEYVTDRILLAKDKGLNLAFQAGTRVPFVNADRDLVGEALGILLTNALNYTPAGGMVDVRTLKQRVGRRTWAGIAVSDTGPGLEPDDLQRLFTRFFRGKAGIGSGMAGTGLGLAIASEILERHHGRIEASNRTKPHHGAVFQLWLPHGKGGRVSSQAIK